MEIRGHIADAQLLEPQVKEKLDAYLAVRHNKNVPADDKIPVYLAYQRAKMKQDELYEKAINKTAALYHVRPKHTDEITIGEPDEADMKFMTGIKATWAPQVTDSGPDVKLAVLIYGNDGPHYSGATKLNPLETDPKKPMGRLAVTLADGRVLIMKDTFKIAVDKENLGFLASVIYHETRHYDRLSWKDKKGKNRSWATIDKEERDAYKAEKHMAEEAFGLSQKDIDFLESQYKAYAKAVKTGKSLTDDDLTPAQETAWRNYYYGEQINLYEEFYRLQKEVEVETAEQLERQRREERERQIQLDAERRERERAEQERRAREEERLRQAKRTVEFYERQDFLNEIARCWYRPIYRNRTDDTIIGFEDDAYRRHHYNYENGTPSVQDLKIMALIMRACDDVDRHIPPDKHKACNDVAPELSKPMRYDLVQNIEKATNYVSAECVNTIMANRGRITDSRSFEKVVVAFHKADNKKKAETAKNERKEKERNQREETPGGGSRRQDGIKRYYDPSCDCWVREY